MRAWARFFLRSLKGEYAAIGRNHTILIILFGVPLIYPSLISWLYHADSAVERPALVVDQDNSGLSRRFTLELDATEQVRVLGRLDSLEAGMDDLVTRRAEMLVYFPPQFAAQVARGEQSSLKVWVNSANVYTYGTALPAVYAVAGHENERFLAGFHHGQGMPSSLAKRRVSPVIQDMRPLFHPSASYGNFFVPGIMVMVIQQLMVIGLAFSVSYQRVEGSLDPRPPLPMTYLLAKATAQAPWWGGGVLLIVLCFMPAFGWTTVSVGNIMLIFLMFIVAMMPFSLLFARLFPDHFTAFEYLMFLSAPVFLMSGFSWPVEQMPGYFQYFVSLFPATFALQALRIAAMRSGDVADILPHLGALAVQACAYAAAAVVMLNLGACRRRRPSPAAPARDAKEEFHETA